MGEVSMVNGDVTDNYFYRPFGRGLFSVIEGDDEPLHLLCNEYSKYWQGDGAL